MNINNTINVLICLDDIKGDYTRHAAVTILSLLETNKMNKIQIWILSSILPKENIDELKRIVKAYNQRIEFIISDNIVPEKLKKVIINKNNLTWGVWYRRFFPKYIKGITRILCIDCDVLVMKDISKIYNMDMQGKAIAGYYDIRPYSRRNKLFGIKNYINAGVLLFDVGKYDEKKITVEKMIKINENFSKYFQGSDQDKINIIFEDDIFIAKEGMNFQISNKWFNKGIEQAEIIHCLQKPYVGGSCAPYRLRQEYTKYLNKTKWKGYPIKKANYGYLHHIYNMSYHFLFNLIWICFGKIYGCYHH